MYSNSWIGWILFTMLNISSAQLGAVDIQCWDGTFAYDTVHFVESDNAFELSLMGALLGPLSFNNFEERISIGQWDRSRLYIPFTKNQCVETDGVFRCEKVAIAPFGNRVSMYVDRNVNDMGSNINVISQVEAKSITAIFKPGESIHVKISDANNGGTNDEQVIQFGATSCGEEVMPHLRDLAFPDRLKAHLNRG